MGVCEGVCDSHGVLLVFDPFESEQKSKKKKEVAARGFDPRTSGLWAQHASSAPSCCPSDYTQDEKVYKLLCCIHFLSFLRICIWEDDHTLPYANLPSDMRHNQFSKT